MKNIFRSYGFYSSSVVEKIKPVRILDSPRLSTDSRLGLARIIRTLVTALLMAFFSFDVIAINTPPPSSPVVKKAKKATKKSRRLKYVAPPEDELKVETMPAFLPIPDEAIKALAENNLSEGLRIIRAEPPSSKTLHLLREIQRILGAKKSKGPSHFERHEYYLNLGIAYHNVYLFLKRHDITNSKFFSAALKYYRKVEWTKSPTEKYKAYILSAALTAVNGDVSGAKKLFDKIILEFMGDDYKTLMYLASYYAAISHVNEAVDCLKKAHTLKPEQVYLWTKISDDFLAIENTESFRRLASEWRR